MPVSCCKMSEGVNYTCGRAAIGTLSLFTGWRAEAGRGRMTRDGGGRVGGRRMVGNSLKVPELRCFSEIEKLEKMFLRTKSKSCRPHHGESKIVCPPKKNFCHHFALL